VFAGGTQVYASGQFFLATKAVGDRSRKAKGHEEEKMTHPDRFAATPLKRGFFGLNVAR
jgi:hypothetical protein